MNIPNKITVSRILLIPVFVIIMMFNFGMGDMTLLGVTLPINHVIGGIIFIFASATDWVDGYYARKYNLVTTFGKFLDPLADKLLVSAAFILLVEMGTAPAWIIIIIISREFAVTGLRLVLAGEGEVVAANQLGKIKTVTQIFAIVLGLFHNPVFAKWDIPFDSVMLYIALIFTIWSGADYFYKNRHALLTSK